MWPPRSCSTRCDEPRASSPQATWGVNFLSRAGRAASDPDPEVRRRLIDRLVREERVEIYTTEDGTKAMRVKRSAPFTVAAQHPATVFASAGPLSPAGPAQR